MGRNKSKKRSKLETVDAAIAIANESSEKMLQDIHQANLDRGHREMERKDIVTKVNRPISKRKIALGDITNKYQESCIEVDIADKPKEVRAKKRKMCQGDEKRTVQARMQRNNPSKVSTSSEVMRGIGEIAMSRQPIRKSLRLIEMMRSVKTKTAEDLLVGPPLI